MRQLLLFLSLPTILVVISVSQSVSMPQKSSSNVPEEKEEWNIGMPVHEKPSRHKRDVSGFVKVAGVLIGIISGIKKGRQLADIQRSLKELDRKINGISRDIETVLYNQQTKLYSGHVRRLRFFLSQMEDFLMPQNGTWGPAKEAQSWADSVLDSCSNGVAQILHDMHCMVDGTSHVFAKKPIFLVFEEALNGSSPNYSSQVQEIVEFLDSIQSLGYAVWMNALFIKGRNSSFAAVESVLQERLTNQTKLMRQLTTGWPSGSYGLPMTDTGCPDETETGVQWETGYRRHDTVSYNEWSENLHFPPGSWGKDFVEQHFCMMNNEAELRRWPNGEYCIFRRNDCPKGFSTGYVRWDDDDYYNDNRVNGSRPEGNYYFRRGETTIYFCCRRDGSFSIPIDLPTAKPFYLLRYKSTCQQVRNMRLSTEFFWWDDQNTYLANNRSYAWGAHPDTGWDTNNHKIHYCYYS